MATLKGQTIAASYQDLVKRADTYAQTGTNVEIMDDSAVVQPTGLYLESGATTDNVGIGVSDPDELLELYKVGTQLKLSGGAADYATFAVAADGALTITTVDVDAAEADIILAPDGNIGIGTASPSVMLNLESATSTAITAENTGNSAVVLNLDANRSGADQGLGNINFKWNGTAVAQISGASGADTTNKDDGQIQFSTMSGGSSSVNMTLDKDGNVGIGTAAPSNNVEIFTDSNAEGLLIKSTGNTFSKIEFDSVRTSAEHGLGQINFAWDGTGVAAILGIAGDDTSNKDNGHIVFYTAAAGTQTEKVRIDEDGNVGIGTAAPSQLLTVDLGGDGDIAYFKGTNAGLFIQSAAGVSSLVSHDGSNFDAIRLRTGAADANSLQVETSGDVTVGAGDIVFGTAGKGICLGVTSNTDANTLDDYEEGTFTPTFSNIGNGTYTYQLGRYTKIGNMVYCQVHLDINALGTASGSVIVASFPFTSANNAGEYASASSIYGNSWSVSRDNLTGLAGPNATTMQLYYDSGASPVQHSDLGTANLLFDISYIAA